MAYIEKSIARRTASAAVALGLLLLLFDGGSASAQTCNVNRVNDPLTGPGTDCVGQLVTASPTQVGLGDTIRLQINQTNLPTSFNATDIQVAIGGPGLGVLVLCDDDFDPANNNNNVTPPACGSLSSVQIPNNMDFKGLTNSGPRDVYVAVVDYSKSPHWQAETAQTIKITQQSGGGGGGGSGNQPPSPDFSFSPASPGVGQSVQFTDQTTDPDGNLMFVRWDFGDGTPSGSKSPGTTVQHTYAQSGTYTVRFCATDGVAPEQCMTKSITVQPAGGGGGGGGNAAPSADFDVSPANPQVGQSVTFTDRSTDPDGPGDLQTWRWDFGDGTIGQGQNPTHSYSQAGRYPVTLVVIDAARNRDTASQTITVGSPGGGGGGGGGNAAPTAKFSASTANPQVGQTVTFTNQSTDPDGAGDIVGSQWDFGDGTTDSVASPTHVYRQAGTYTVTLTVADAARNRDTATQTITVGSSGGGGGGGRNNPPTAKFDYSPSNPRPGQSVDFTDRSSDPDGAGDIASREWKFGDNQTDTGSDVDHSYNSAGTYIVTLVVTDQAGNVSSTSRAVRVRAGGGGGSGNRWPSVGFSYSPQSPSVGESVSFKDESSDPDGIGDIAVWNWEFGDGSLSGQQNPTHSFRQPGSYEVKLTITDKGGHTISATRTINVGSGVGRGDGGGSVGTISSLQDADTNGNCLIDTPEFVTVIDGWINGSVSDSVFFDAIDAWTQETNVCATSEALRNVLLDGVQAREAASGVAFSVSGQNIDGIGVTVYDLNGDRVFQETSSGQQLVWNLRTVQGEPLENGVYLYRLRAHSFSGVAIDSKIQKLMILR